MEYNDSNWKSWADLVGLCETTDGAQQPNSPFAVLFHVLPLVTRKGKNREKTFLSMAASPSKAARV
jgi:hypothetical protein